MPARRARLRGLLFELELLELAESGPHPIAIGGAVRPGRRRIEHVLLRGIESRAIAAGPAARFGQLLGAEAHAIGPILLAGRRRAEHLAGDETEALLVAEIRLVVRVVGSGLVVGVGIGSLRDRGRRSLGGEAGASSAGRKPRQQGRRGESRRRQAKPLCAQTFRPPGPVQLKRMARLGFPRFRAARSDAFAISLAPAAA